jgi:predicted Zn-dependent peptidase
VTSNPFEQPVTQRILSHTYDNGLVLVAEPMMSLESAAFTFLTPAGSVYDPPERAGLATLTNELCMRGCGSRDSRKFVEDLDNLGVERGEGVSELHTNYRGATLAKNLAPALAIYADLLRRPQLPPEQLEPSRLVAVQELQSIEDEPSQKVMQELGRRHYPSPWGRPSQGDLAGLESITVADVQQCHAQLYRPNGTILGVAGHLNWDELRMLVGRLLGDWKRVDGPTVRETPRAARHEHLEHESNQTQIAIAYDAVPYNHPDYFQVVGAVGVLSGGMSARLFTEVREKRGLCYSVYATLHSLLHRGSVFCYAGTGTERAQETLDVTLAELARLAAGITAEELARLKARIKSGLIMQQESSSARSGSLARDWFHLGRARTLDEVGELVDRLSPESINHYLAANPPRDFTIVTLGPAALSVPA